jgi:hypothetical protein
MIFIFKIMENVFRKCESDNSAKSQSTKLESEFRYRWNDQNSNVK